MSNSKNKCFYCLIYRAKGLRAKKLLEKRRLEKEQRRAEAQKAGVEWQSDNDSDDESRVSSLDYPTWKDKIVNYLAS